MQFLNMKHSKWAVIIAIAVTSFTSCIKNKFDEPPVDGYDPGLVPTITIDALKNTYNGTRYLIQDSSMIIAGVVAADDKSGNFYKTLILQDETSGIAIRLDQSGLSNSYMIGRKVYIRCGGLYLGSYNGLVQLGGAATAGSTTEVDPLPSTLIARHLVKGMLNQPLEAVPVTISELNIIPANSYTMQNRLIKLENVQFSPAFAGYAYADGALQLSKNAVIKQFNASCGVMDSIVLRNSGFATFANELMPTGKGTLYAIFSVFGNTKQLFIRDIEDVQFNETRCNDGTGGPIGGSITIFEEKFNGQACQTCTAQPVTAPLNLPGWSILAETGTVTWVGGKAGVNGSNPWAQCSAFNSGNAVVKTWMITPAINLDNTTSEKLEFRGTGGFDNGAVIKLFVSNNYVPGANPGSATWTELSYNTLPSSPGNQYPSFASSGLVDLSAYSGNVYLGWAYVGGTGQTTTWEVDNIIVTGEQ